MSPGPIPKRSEERIRRNKGEEITRIEAVGSVECPNLDIDNAHPIVQSMWDSLEQSAQSIYYEPSDWEFARYTMHFANQLLHSSRPSAQMLQVVNAAFADLLVSEGSRRRVRLEVERNKSTADVVDIADLFRERMQQGPS